MRINRQILPLEKEISLSEDIDFSAMKFDQNFLRRITFCHVEAKACQYHDLLRVIVNIRANVVAVSAYSLKDVKLPLKLRDELIFSDDENDESAFYEPDNVFVIDEYILGLILAAVPSKVVNKGEKLPSDGSDYRIISEEDFLKEKKEKRDPRWQKLDSVKINNDDN
ncbi:MAG: hypothetical protein WC201_04735 [Bacilli bacterium]